MWWELNKFRPRNSHKIIKSCLFLHVRSYIVKTWLQLTQIWKIKVLFTHVVTWFPDLDFTRRSYSKLHVNFYFFMPPEVILYLAVPTLSPYLVSNIKYWNHDSVTHLIALLRYPLFACQQQLLLFFVACILLHLHLVSCGLCSWIYLLIFPFRNEVRVDTNTELVVLYVT